jgi:hypothetical protein
VVALWGFLRSRKRFWLPIVALTLIFAVLIMVSERVHLVPFIYTRL